MIKITKSHQFYTKSSKKYLDWKRRSRLTFNNKQNTFFSIMKLNSPTHVYLRQKQHLFLIIMHWIYFKYNDLFHALNVYKIPAKEHYLVLRWTAGKISVLKTLFCKCLKYAP